MAVCAENVRSPIVHVSSGSRWGPEETWLTEYVTEAVASEQTVVEEAPAVEEIRRPSKVKSGSTSLTGVAM